MQEIIKNFIHHEDTKVFDRNWFDKITAEELKYLARYVELLKQLTKASCEKKMELFV
jgi:hypothetical protein